MVKMILLGILQGLTEFLPISSSGHLVIAKLLLGIEEKGALVEVALHTGTLFAILIYYRNKIIHLIKKPHTLIPLFIASLPAGIAGIAFGGTLEKLFGSPLIAGIGLICTGLILLSVKYTPKGEESPTPISAIFIGIAQALAIIPGISRSGSTIVCARWLKIESQEAVDFSFLMALIAIGGATLIKVKDISHLPLNTLFPLLAGTVASAIAGLISIPVVKKLVAKLFLFGFYCIPLGTVVLILTLL